MALSAGHCAYEPPDRSVGSREPICRRWRDGNALGERISVEQTFRAVTVDAAYILGMEDRIGSFEPGKFADFAVLEDDPFALDVTEIRDIDVWGTVLSGKLFPSTR